MLEPTLIHTIRMSSIFTIELLRIGPIWAVAECWPEESVWYFFDKVEWVAAVEQYRKVYYDRIKADRTNKIYADYWDIHHEVIEYDELKKQYKERYGEELYSGNEN